MLTAFAELEATIRGSDFSLGTAERFYHVADLRLDSPGYIFLKLGIVKTDLNQAEDFSRWVLCLFRTRTFKK